MSNYILILTSLLLVLYSRPALSQTSQAWKLFELKQLTQKNKTTDGSYFRFLNEPTLSMGLYELKAGTADAQNHHQLDEVYYIIKGKALLVAGVDTVGRPLPGPLPTLKPGYPTGLWISLKNCRWWSSFPKPHPLPATRTISPLHWMNFGNKVHPININGTRFWMSPP